MTTLSSTLIGSGSSMGLEKANRPGFWQRLGGSLRRSSSARSETSGGSRDNSSEQRRRRSSPLEKSSDAEFASANDLANTEQATAESLLAIVDDEAMNDLQVIYRENEDLDSTAASTIIDEPQAATTSAGVNLGGPSLVPSGPPHRVTRAPISREEVFDEVRQGIGALASLLTGIQSHMELQSTQQREMMAYLGQIPAAAAQQNERLLEIREQIAMASENYTGSLHAIGERVADAVSIQTDSLREISSQIYEGTTHQSNSLEAIRAELSRGSSNQARLCDVLDRLGGLQETTGQALTNISRRVELMDGRDQSFTQSLEKVCDAMHTVSRASQTSAVVLDRVETSIASRDEGMRMTLERTIDKHQTKFNALTAVAIAVSVAALAVVAGVAFLVMTKMH